MEQVVRDKIDLCDRIFSNMNKNYKIKDTDKVYFTKSSKYPRKQFCEFYNIKNVHLKDGPNVIVFNSSTINNLKWTSERVKVSRNTVPYYEYLLSGFLRAFVNIDNLENYVGCVIITDQQLDVSDRKGEAMDDDAYSMLKNYFASDLQADVMIGMDIARTYNFYASYEKFLVCFLMCKHKGLLKGDKDMKRIVSIFKSDLLNVKL